MIPDKIYLPEEEIESRMPWIEQPCEDDPNWDVCYIRKDMVEHIICGALGPQDALNKIRSL